MQYASALIVNHGVITTSSSALSSRVERTVAYVARLAAHLERGGLDLELTDDDKRLLRIQDMVDYRSRQGSYSGRRVDIPASPGEVSGGCFDLSGVRDPDTLAEEIMQSGSNLITSVVSVKREDAERLGLTSKQDFQRLYREKWQEHVDKLGVIKPQDMRTVAFYHTDNPKNLHIHVLTWDASGRFSGESLIPKKNIMPARQTLVQEVYKDDLKKLYYAKDYVRVLTLTQLRATLGQEIGIETYLKLSKLKESVSLKDYQDLSLSPVRGLDTLEKDMLKKALFQESTSGYVQYGSLSKEKRDVVDTCRESIVQNSPQLKTLIAHHTQICEELAEMNGYKGEASKYYLKRHADDLNRRLNNAITRDVSNKPELSSRDIITENARSISSIAALSVRNLDVNRAEQFSWAFTPEQKREVEGMFVKLKVCSSDKTKAPEFYALRDTIMALPSVQARITQAAHYLSNRYDMHYREAYVYTYSEFQRSVEIVINSSFQEKERLLHSGSSSTQDMLSALVYALPSKAILGKNIKDSTQRNMSWKNNRLKHALGRENTARQRQWNMMG